MIRSLLVSFGVTVAVECIAAFLLGLRDKRSLLIVFLANVITNPAVVYTVTLLHLWVFPWEKAALATPARRELYFRTLRPNVSSSEWNSREISSLSVKP